MTQAHTNECVCISCNRMPVGITLPPLRIPARQRGEALAGILVILTLLTALAGLATMKMSEAEEETKVAASCESSQESALRCLAKDLAELNEAVK